MATSTATGLASLKFTVAKKVGQMSATQFRRNKLVGRIEEQIALATAAVEGRIYAPSKLKTVTDEDGVRRTVETAKKVKQWWFAAEGGKIALTVRYGAKVLCISGVKGRDAVEIASLGQLVPTLQVLRDCAANGEMDAAIEAAGAALRKGFSK